ncbi:c-type cytochrome [Azospirillum sp. ST 5-10]|uniref:c-type cytochrome n=1 Tax=unclassified Azospirillum TaxID=2630922 RepID=UPI003F4A36B6
MLRLMAMAGMVAALAVGGTAALAGGGALAAEDGPGSAATGRALAAELCADCHVVLPDQPVGDFPEGPDLIERMGDPGVTEMALRSYLQTSHPVMPNIRLSREQTDDLVAYLLTLKR